MLRLVLVAFLVMVPSVLSPRTPKIPRVTSLAMVVVTGLFIIFSKVPTPLELLLAVEGADELFWDSLSALCFSRF